MTSQPVIRRLVTAEEAAWCAALMAASEPWITLGRSAEASLRIIQDPVPKLSPEVLYRVQYLVREADWCRSGEEAQVGS